MADAPEVELMRLADGEPIDAIAPVDEPRAGKQHVFVAGASQRTQQAGDHGAGMRPQDLRVAHVARVPRVARRGLGRVPEQLVVVRDPHERVGAMDDHVAVPGLAQRRHGVVDEELKRVRPVRRVRQIRKNQRLPISSSRDEHRLSSRGRRSRNRRKPRLRTPEGEAS